MSTTLRCDSCQWSTPPCYRSFFDLTVNIRHDGESIDRLVADACHAEESVTEVHCVKCWLSKLKKSVDSLVAGLRIEFIQKIDELESLPGCDYDEASKFD